MQARVDAQNSPVRGLLEEGQQLRREKEVAQVIDGEVGFQALLGDLSALSRPHPTSKTQIRGGGEGSKVAERGEVYMLRGCTYTAADEAVVFVRMTYIRERDCRSIGLGHVQPTLCTENRSLFASITKFKGDG